MPLCRLKSDIEIRFMLISIHFFNHYTLFMILMNKYSQNLFRHADGSILDKNIKTDGTEKDGSGLLFFVAASLVLSLIIFYTS
jgi:hypothetical protein